MTRRELLGGAWYGVSIVLVLSCGSDKEDRSSPDEPGSRQGSVVVPPKETQHFTLAVLDHPLAVTPGQNAIQAWTEGHVPGAALGTELQLTKVPMQGGIKEFLGSQAASGVAVDLIWLPHSEDMPDLFKSGLLAPLDRWLEVDQSAPLEAFAVESRHLVRFRAQTFALPLAIAPVVLAHNSSRFERANLAAPTSDWKWIDFIEAGKSLTEDINGDGTPDRWGFMAPGHFPEWLVFLHQQDVAVVDLDTSQIGMDGPASIRALTAWDELGRVHGILPYGPDTSVARLQGLNDFLQRGMQFTYYFNSLPQQWREVTPLPTGARSSAPLALAEALAVPDAAQGDRVYEALVPLALWIAERRAMPATTAGWQFIQRPDRDHFNLIFAESTQDTLLDALHNAKASHVASSPGLSQGLFNIVTYRLARDEVGIEQAIEQARNWLQNYVGS
ncbi:MAG: extracellular solute-binding protein [Chloroflexi bacterium]|nr:extracellular solute-binding protein [Chloroflexota bacterium]